VSLEPAFDDFDRVYEAGAPQVVFSRLIDDLETPVSAYLKIAYERPYAFLFESVEGGAYRGRYSIVAMKPDLVWRCNGDVAEIAEGDDIEAGRFTPQKGGALDSLRDLVAASRIALPKGLPPMATGVFGALGYDMIRLVERLPNVSPDPLSLPDAVMMRPSIVAVFDAIGQEIILVTSVRASAAVSAKEAYSAARSRLEETIADLRRPLAHDAPSVRHEPPEFISPVDRAAYHRIVEKAKAYIEAGDIFQVVPSHRFRAPFELHPFALYRSLRRTNPSPFLFYLNYGRYQLVGSSPEILVRLRDGKITIRPIAGTRPRGKTPEEDIALEKELLADPKERAEHLMLLDLGRNDVGRVAMLRQEGRNTPSEAAPAAADEMGGRANVRVTESFTIERYSHVMHIVSNVES
jgi:anthranilate synthase component I